MSKLANQRFSQIFEQKRTALVPYVTAGFPLPDTTITLMHALVASGADIIELGVPFSDPAADGTVIQKAGEHALERGMNLRKVLEIVREFRATNAVTPVVLMGYANPIERMGRDLFVTLAAEAGVDGVLVVDYPPEESADFSEMLENNGMAQIFLLAPTSTPERMKNVAQMAKGYVYYVSLNGVTGAGHLDTAAVASKLNEIRQYLSIPIGVGFGIRDAQSAKAVAASADAVVIGSKILQLMQESIEQQPEEYWTEYATKAAAEWLQTIRTAMDE